MELQINHPIPVRAHRLQHLERILSSSKEKYVKDLLSDGIIQQDGVAYANINYDFIRWVFSNNGNWVVLSLDAPDGVCMNCPNSRKCLDREARPTEAGHPIFGSGDLPVLKKYGFPTDEELSVDYIKRVMFPDGRF